MRQLCVWIDPTDDEYCVALIDGPLDEGILRPQVKNVELVDPRRHDDQRHRRYLIRGRFVLDQFHQVVAEDHLSRRGRHIDADFEGILVDHLDAQAAVAFFQVFEKILQAVEKIFATGFRRGAKDFRVRHGEIGR